ncbi:hypothetical protein HMPREF0063_11986 [Aeromicrobium marinum DSM 15272]|uniref:Uncharacterized protein n=1 Tax=Aeromicrobium marinum DSM 15272 TaxID=585531 RepID=E2SE50_9ACTN|nr:hypothetical protein [Aeromicrobium marinum]EFQ82777.1 hypothetical protein HMPREF0063_11986 [Aeromicrobium marinum DSM 15272]
MTGIWFDEAEDAEEIVKALQAEGYRTELRRESFAGEDDSDDRAWLLEVDPFDDRVVEMVDVYGGWMPGDDRLPAEPLDLPAQPRRIKRPEG